MTLAHPADLRDASRSLTSQHGEDGIISAIFERIGTGTRRCVEFGAYDLVRDSNVYTLWHDAGWDALLIEGNEDRARSIQRAYENLTTTPAGRVTIQAGLVSPSGPSSLDARLALQGWDDVDLCVIDVDGMDYHIFEGIRTRPRVVLIEFNPTIPIHLSVIGAISGNYLGASARALFDLARAKGYSLVACTKTNLVLVRDDLAEGFEGRNDIDSMFEPWAITYMMTSYDGSVFCSRPPVYNSNIFSPRAAADLSTPDAFWVPRRDLGRSYIFTRAAFEMVSAVAGPVAAATLRVLRAIRKRTGMMLFAPRREH